MKGLLVKGLEMPDCCASCFFCGDMQLISEGNGLYRKISRCLIADVDDPWRDLTEQVKNRAEYCKLEEVKP